MFLGGAGSTTSSLDGIFKRNYGSGGQVFEQQQNLNAKMWGEVKVSPLKPSAQGAYMPVSISGNESGSAINESQGFQEPESFNPQQPRVLAQLIVWPFSITGKSIELSQTNKQAFAVSLDSQMKDNLGRMMSDLNRQMYGGGTGQMSLVNGAVVASTSIIVDDILPFRENMKIDCWTAVGGVKQVNGALITAVNYQTLTLTVDAAVSCDDNAIIVKHTVLDNAPPDGKELAGFRKVCDTTTFGASFEGLAVASNNIWQGNVIDAGGAPLSQDFLQRTADSIFLIGGARAKKLISNTGQRRTFLATEVQKTRYENSTIEGGFTKLKWNEYDWMVDKDYPIAEVGLMDSDNFEKFQTRDVHLADDDGKTVSRIQGYDKIAGYYRYVGNLGSWKRNAHGRLINLSDPLSSGV